MILRRIRVQGWKCFSNPVEIDSFDERLNIIHAPNGSGKTKLFQALLRGLLDGHRVKGEDINRMRPWGKSLAPTVTIEFSHGNQEYKLEKRFLDRPFTNLYRNDGDDTFQRYAEGDVADETVRRILLATPPARGLSSSSNWGLAQILWVPQNKLALPELDGDVIKKIQGAMGTEVVGQEAGPLEKRIEKTYFEIYTPTGKFITGNKASDFIHLKEKLEYLEDEHRQALEKVESFEEKSKELKEYHRLWVQAKEQVETLKTQQEKTQEEVDKFKKITSYKDKFQAEVESFEAKHDELAKRIKDISEVKKEEKELSGKLAEWNEEEPKKKKKVEELESKEKEAADSLNQLNEKKKNIKLLRKKSDLAKDFINTKVRFDSICKQISNIEEVISRIEEDEKVRKELKAPDEKTLREIRLEIKNRDEIQTKLDASLISLEIHPLKTLDVEVIKGEQEGLQEISAKKSLEAKGSPEVIVEIKDIARIKAKGPAGSVKELKKELEKSSQKIVELTQEYQTTEISELEELRDRAQEIDVKISEKQTRLETLLDGKSVKEIQVEQKGLEKMLKASIGEHPEWETSMPDYRKLEEEVTIAEKNFAEEEEKARTGLGGIRDELAEERKHLEILQERKRNAEDQLEKNSDKMTELTQDGLDETKRQKELNRLAMDRNATKAELSKIITELETFTENPEIRLQSLREQISQVSKDADDARLKEKGAEAVLKQLSSESPYFLLSKVDEETASVEEQLKKERLHVEAIRLLYSTANQCRTEAIDAVAEPVEDSATNIFKQIAGDKLGDVSIGKDFQPSGVNPKGTDEIVDVEELSGGEKEQIYIAVRLALADVLVQDERQMVVLDDALMATDSIRMEKVLHLLEEFSERMQIIILTYNLDRYKPLQQAKIIDCYDSGEDGQSGYFRVCTQGLAESCLPAIL